MAPYKTTRLTNVASSGNRNVSFSAKKNEGQNVERIICTPKYVTVHELKKPAVVTDRLRRDYDDLRCYDRLSMKNGVRKILQIDDVVQAVNAYWSDGTSPNASNTFNNDDDSSLVSIVIELYRRKNRTHDLSESNFNFKIVNEN